MGIMKSVRSGLRSWAEGPLVPPPSESRAADPMSDQDHVKPYHAGDASPGKEAADVVAEVLQHAAEREQAAKKKVVAKGPPKWTLPLTVNLGVLALYFLIAQPDFLIVSPIEDPRPAAVEIESATNALYLEGIQRINMFVAANGRLPETLEEAGSFLADQGVDYTTQGDDYILIYTIEGAEPIVFNSGTQDPLDFAPVLHLPG